MSDDSASFTIDLPVTGQGGVDAASASIDTLAARLDVATKASQAASDAVKVAEASYSRAEGHVDKLSKALERVGVAADAQRGKLRVATDLGDVGAITRAEAQIRELARQEEQLAGKVVASKNALIAEAAALDMVRSKAATAAEAEKKLRTEADKAGKGGEGEGIKWEKLERGLGRFEGPIADVGSKVARLAGGWNKLKASIGESGFLLAATIGVTALATAVIAAAAAVGSFIVSTAEWGIRLADVNRTNLLLAQGMTRSAIGGIALNDQLNYLTRRLPLTREELAATAQGLIGMGLRGKDLAKALQATAIRAAQIKFGPEFQEQMLSLSEQSKVLQSNIGETFGGLHTDALMKGFQVLVRLFDSSTESGRAMKVVFESIFQPLIDRASDAMPKVERFFLQLEIWALKALIAIKPFGSTILHVGEAFLLGAAIIGGIFTAALVLVVGLVVGAVTAIGALVYGFWRLAEAGSAFGEMIGEKLRSINLLEVGKAIIAGLADGIKAGGAAVVSAVEGAAHGAVEAAKRALGIHSPSKVFAEIGAQTGAGMEQGVDRSAPAVGSALERVASPPVLRGSPGRDGAAGSGAGGRSGASLDMAGATFNFYGVEGAEDAESRFSGLLTRLLEGDASQFGASPEVT